MSRKQIIILLCVLACAGIAFFVAKRLHGPGTTDSDDQAIPTIVSVQTGKLTRVTLHGYVDGFGTIEATPAVEGQQPASAHLASAVSSVVTEVNVGEGQHVEKGQVLFQLQSQAADIAVEYAKKTLKRQVALLQATNTSLKAVQDAQQQLADATAQQALYRIRAPLAGTVLHVNARPGEAVDLATPLADIVDLDRLIISSAIPVADTAGLKAGQKVIVLTEPPVDAELSYISPQVDSSNDTVTVRAAVSATNGLRLGQFVKLRIVTDERANCLAAPSQSVVTGPDDKEVVALVTGDEAAQVPVKTGLRDGGLVEVEGQGLKEGDTVVTLGAYGLPAKSKVHVANP